MFRFSSMITKRNFWRNWKIPKVIVNSTPLIVLCGIGHLDILKELYQEIMIPAQEKGAELVILDDNAAKKTAKYLGLTVTGTMGVLLKAKKQGIIKDVRPLLLEMKQNGFYISKKIERIVLEQAGE